MNTSEGDLDMSADTLTAGDELDLSNDSAVEIVTAVWQITEVENEETSSDNGSGKRVNLTFEAEDDAFPFPITVRYFTEYTPADPSKNTDWVKRQRGQLKNVAKAAGVEPKGIDNPDSENYLLGKRVTATTKDGGDGFPVLGKFKKVG